MEGVNRTAARSRPATFPPLASVGKVYQNGMSSSLTVASLPVAVVAALLTPPDAISQTIMAVPMYLLYEGGLLMARLMTRLRDDDPAAAGA